MVRSVAEKCTEGVLENGMDTHINGRVHGTHVGMVSKSKVNMYVNNGARWYFVGVIQIHVLISYSRLRS